jgi:Leucine-rich repeat (LRR) protein
MTPPYKTPYQCKEKATEVNECIFFKKDGITSITTTALSTLGCDLNSSPSPVHSLRLCRLRLTSEALSQSVLPNLSCVTLLDLSHNLLHSLPPLPSLSRQLLSLHLDYNRLVDLELLNLTTLSSLQTLTVSNNQITRVDSLTALTNLTHCDLSDNDIATLDPHIGLLTSLRVLNLHGNPLKHIRRTILERGTSAILSYLRSRLSVTEEK